jgi:hypothetical protein
MKKIVRLTESDLERLVQKIIKEEGEDVEMSQGLQTKTDRIMDLPAFEQLVKAIKSKNADQQVEVIMTLLKQMDLKGNFGIKFKQALKTLG